MKSFSIFINLIIKYFSKLYFWAFLNKSDGWSSFFCTKLNFNLEVKPSNRSMLAFLARAEMKGCLLVTTDGAEEMHPNYVDVCCSRLTLCLQKRWCSPYRSQHMCKALISILEYQQWQTNVSSYYLIRYSLENSLEDWK